MGHTRCVSFPLRVLIAACLVPACGALSACAPGAELGIALGLGQAQVPGPGSAPGPERQAQAQGQGPGQDQGQGPGREAQGQGSDEVAGTLVATAPQLTAGTLTATAPPPGVPEDQRAQVASLLMPGVVSFDDALAKLNAGVGGIFITSWADPGLLTQPGRDINALREIVGRPFDVAIDFEGGRVQRFSDILGTYPSPQVMAATHTPAEVEEQGRQVGQSLRAHGINVDFAPVLDVEAGGLEVVGDRSYSRDPALAGQYGAAFARGLESAGVRAVFKHFPGHGRASGDTHQAMATTPPLDQLFTHDLIPFDIALDSAPGAAVMVGHMVVPGLGPSGVPASLNNHAYGLLRNTYGYDGVVYTDDLTGMRAITDTWSPEQAVVQAIAAGADQALWSTAVDINRVIDTLNAAVDSGQIHPARFQAAVYRAAGTGETGETSGAEG